MRSDPDVTEVIEIAPSAEINSVDPELEVLDLVANTVGMKGKNVSARATVKLVPAMSREQDVIPCTALQLVVAGEAKMMSSRWCRCTGRSPQCRSIGHRCCQDPA